MIIECSNCHTKYQYDDARFEGKPSKKIRCAKCQQVFEINNPGMPAPRPHASDFDRTMNRIIRPATAEPEPEAQPQQPAPEMDQELKLPIGRRLSLAIIDGNDAGSVHRIDKPRVVIGRTGADVNVDDGEASRNHAAIEIRDTVFTLEDLGSTNGTFVNGDRISAPVELTNQGEFQIGATTLMLIVTDDA